MASQIMFFKKNKGDYGLPNVSATASQGSAYAIYALNRSNNSAWVTTGSVDADNTTWTVDFGDPKRVDRIFLLKHNFKSFTVKYWNGSTWAAFSPAINVSGNTAESNIYSVASVSTTKIQVQITGTQTADRDKYLYQFVATELIGQLAGWPVVKNPIISRNRRKNQMLSGKLNVAENVGAFSCELTVSEWKSDADMTIVESLFDSNDGFLVWLCGGDESQFSSVRQGYRFEDLPLVKCENEYKPEFVRGMYQRGLNVSLKLAEVVD